MGAPGAKEALLPARFRAMRDYAARIRPPRVGSLKMLVCRYARFWSSIFPAAAFLIAFVRFLRLLSYKFHASLQVLRTGATIASGTILAVW